MYPSPYSLKKKKKKYGEVFPFPYFKVEMVYFYWHLYREVPGWLYICREKVLSLNSVNALILNFPNF